MVESTTLSRPPGTAARHLPRVAAFALVLLVTVLVYRPGLAGPFLFDDYPVFVRSYPLAMTDLDLGSIRDAFYSSGRAWPRRGLSRLSLALNHYFSGGRFDPLAIKSTNLAIHLLNGLLVLALCSALTRRLQAIGTVGVNGPPARMLRWLPVVVTALWLLHPLQLAGVLYAVQRMASMAGTFVLLGLLVFIHGRTRIEAGRGSGFAWMFAGLAVGAAGGFLAKQNAILLPFFALLVELFFFDRSTIVARTRALLRGFYGLTVVIPIVVGLAGMLLAWDFVLGTYAHRHFTPVERLLTEARILWMYVGLLTWPDVRSFALHHDDIALSTGLMAPWTTLPAVAAWLVLIAAAATRGVRCRSPWAFALLWFLVGHALESGIIGLELVFEHRNYVPVIGPLFAAGYYAMAAAERLRLAPRLAPAIGVAVISVLAFSTFARANVWSDVHSLFETAVRNHPDSARAHGQSAMLESTRTGDPEIIIHHWQRAAALNPREVLALVEMSKMLQAYILAAGSADGGTLSALADGPPPDPLSSPLRADPAYLRALYVETVAEATRRLQEGPVETSTVIALINLRGCIDNAVAPCVAMLPHAIEWLELVAGNPRTLRADRSATMVQLAKLYAVEGRVDEAVALVERAIAADPGQLHLRFQIALLHIERGDAASAQEAIDEIDIFTRRTRARADELEILRERLRGLEAPVLPHAS